MNDDETILRTSPVMFPLYTYIRSDSADYDQSFRALLPPVNKRERYVFLPSAAPQEFEGRKVWKDYLSRVGDQKNCGGCYAFASTSALADQYNIQTLGKVHHAVVLDGWGEEDGMKFWWVRNSWSRRWGEA